MSISSSSSNSSGSSLFNFSGLVSGMNTSDIVTKLMSLEQAPLKRLQSQQTKLAAIDTAYSDLNTKLTAFQSAAANLLLPSNVNAKTATSSAATVATATANAGAVNGTFSVLVNKLATATRVSSSTGGGAASAIGNAASSTAALNAAGLGAVPSSGTFSINGKTITIDSTVDSLNSVVSKINAAGAGVTASLANDQYGRPNVLQLSGASPVQLGAGADTSNFISAVGLVANGTNTVQSNLLGSAQTSAALSSANLSTAVSASGSFSVNGVAINWSSGDSLSSVLGRINSAGAGVSATYDPTADRVTFTNLSTGNQAISLADTSGNFLQAVGLVDPGTGSSVTQSYGQTASYSINGGATQYSNSNSVSNAIPGVTITLASAQAGGSTPVNITVGQDTATSASNLTAFANAFNALTDAIATDTQINTQTNTRSVLTGDSTITGIDDRLRSMMYSPVSGLSGQYTTLADIGLSTGSYGSALNTTRHLTVDQNKLSAALNNNPTQVQAVISGVMNSITAFTRPSLGLGGLFDAEKQSYATQNRDLTSQIINMQTLLDQRQTMLQSQFTQMEQAMARLQAQGNSMMNSLNNSSTGNR